MKQLGSADHGAGMRRSGNDYSIGLAFEEFFIELF
jgi:hypothetical protein